MQVIIIDDNMLDLTVMKSLVEKIEGSKPLCFTSSLEAVKWCEGNDPDLVLVDYMMPQLDGLEFIQRFRSIPGRADVPVVMVTVASERDVCYQALQFGANDFLNKPVDSVELQAKLKNMLALRTASKQLADRVRKLEEAMQRIRKLEGILPICFNCKKINKEGADARVQESWMPLDEYIMEKTDAEFSHGLCPECSRKIYPDLFCNK